MHVRQAIRENIATALTGLTTTGTNVYTSRVYPVATLPCLLIYSNADELNYETISPPRRLNRRAQFTIEGYVKASTGSDATLDDICSEVETTLYTDRTRGGNAMDTKITNQVMDYSDGGDQPMAVVVITVEVQYTSVEGSPEV